MVEEKETDSLIEADGIEGELVIGGSAVMEVPPPSTVIALADCVPVLKMTLLPPSTFIVIAGVDTLVSVTVIPLAPKKNVPAGSGAVTGTPSTVYITPVGAVPAVDVVPPIRILTSPPPKPLVAMFEPAPIVIVPLEALLFCSVM